MNREWSELNRQMQQQLKRQDTFHAGIDTLLDLRRRLMTEIQSCRDSLTAADYAAMPFRNAKGLHNSSVAWSLWHVFRIEDIVAHTLIGDDEQVFFQGGYQAKTHAPIITTGNELCGDAIAAFSVQLDLDALYAYLHDVRDSTEQMLRTLEFADMKRKITPERKAALLSLGVVSADSESAWLIDYWCGKDIRGLIQMPFSRHWIMHTEAILRIRDKLQ